MQLNLTESDVFTFVLIQSFSALIMIISIGMFRFSRTKRYKLWSVGWVIFTTTAITMLFSFGQGLTLIDGIGLSGMMIGGILLLDGVQERVRKGKELLIFPLIILLGFTMLIIGIVFQLSYSVVFAIPGLFTSYACWTCAMQLRKLETSRSIEFFMLLIGLLILGFATMEFALGIFWELEAILVISLSSGLIITGSGMLPFFIRKTSEALTVQNQISQLVNSILNHDIRNYVSSLGSSIELARTSEDERDSMLDLASEIIVSVEEFISEMRRFMAITTRFRSVNESLDLLDTLKGVVTRVQREYNIPDDNISIAAPIQPGVLTCGIVKELLWNISDNAFKHGSKTMEFNIESNTTKKITLTASDYAGGMTSETLDFMNDPNPFSSSIAPGMGLGLILIRGLSILCGITLKVYNNQRDSVVVGTTYSLTFDRAHH